MPRSLKVILIAFVIAVVPLHSMAAATAYICPAGHPMEAVESPAPAQYGEPSPCDLGIGHCPSGALSDTGLVAIIPDSAASRILLSERCVPAFVPDQPDRPPLVLIR